MQKETYLHKGTVIPHPLFSKPTFSFFSLTYHVTEALTRASANHLEALKEFNKYN